jgi:hypothetical protein
MNFRRNVEKPMNKLKLFFVAAFFLCAQAISRKQPRL